MYTLVHPFRNSDADNHPFPTTARAKHKSEMTNQMATCAGFRRVRCELSTNTRLRDVAAPGGLLTGTKCGCHPV